MAIEYRTMLYRRIVMQLQRMGESRNTAEEKARAILDAADLLYAAGVTPGVGSAAGIIVELVALHSPMPSSPASVLGQFKDSDHISHRKDRKHV